MGCISIPPKHPLPLPLGEVAERSEDGEGKWVRKARSVTFGDSSPSGRAKDASLLGMTRKGGACHSGDGLSLSAAPFLPFSAQIFLHTPCAMCRSFLFTDFCPIFPHKPCSERSPFSTAPCAWPRVGISGLAGLLHISFAYGLRILKIILPIFSDRESECCYEVYL